jgi:hypothetical protein
MNEIYLGDGLYASHDGYQIKLRAPRELGHDCVVYLEPAVLNRLINFVENQIPPPQSGAV